MSNLHAKPPLKSDQGASLAKISRRTFGRSAAAAAALSLSPAALLAQASEFPKNFPIGQKNDSSSRTGRPGGTALHASQEVDAKLANIVRKYGDRLSEEQRGHLRKILVRNQKMMDGIRAFPLQNGDPPASVLKVSFSEKAAQPRTAAARTKKAVKKGEAEGKVR
jgi:hypothetical protein